MKKLASAWILGLLVVINAAQSGDAGKLDPAKLKGDWKYVDGKMAGTDIDKTHLQGVVKIDGDKWIIPAQPGQKNFVMPYKIDATKSPVAVDFTIDEAPIENVVGSKAKGILALDGDTLKLCYNPMGGDRPTAFESTADNKNHLIVLKRAK